MQVQFGWSKSTANSIEEAEKAAQSAMAIDDWDAWTHTALGLVDLISKRYDEAISRLPGPFECHDPSRSQHHLITSSRIPSPPFPLLPDTKLPEPTDQDILTGLQGLLDEFKEGLHQLD